MLSNFKILALTSILFPMKMPFYVPDVLQNGRKFESQTNIESVSVI